MSFGRPACIVAALLTLPSLGWSAQLTEATAAAWDRYLESATSRMEGRLHPPRRFLWADELPDRHLKLLQGEILAALADARVDKPVPNGLIHHWAGAAFIRGVSMEDVFLIANDYDHYPDYFKPTVAQAKLIGQSGDNYWFSMRWRKRVLKVTSAVETEWESVFSRVDQSRWYGLTRSTLVQEVRNPGEPNEARLPPGQGSGYIWRVYGISRYEQRDGGVYLEMESIVLSRDIPAVFRWLVNPIVRSVARSSIVTSLRQAREAVLARACHPENRSKKEDAGCESRNHITSP